VATPAAPAGYSPPAAPTPRANAPGAPAQPETGKPAPVPSTTTTTALPYGPDTCKSGFVWREASSSDHVCVTPDTRAQTQYDNGQAASRWVSGPYGPDTCAQGYVWREAFSGDDVCVTPDTRDQAAYDNAQASSRLVRSG
jgi:hypothetical protein